MNIDRNRRWQQLVNEVARSTETTYGTSCFAFLKGVDQCPLGLLHETGGGVLLGNTWYILAMWAFGNIHQMYPDVESPSRAWYAGGVMWGLPGRLELGTAMYDLLSHHRARFANEACYSPEQGMWLELAQTTNLGCELALKTLVSLVEPNAPAEVYTKEINHSLVNGFRRVEPVQEDLLDIYQSMPLFDDDVVDASISSCGELEERLRLLEGSYQDVRFASTRPSATITRIRVDTHVVLKLAWSAYLLSYDLMRGLAKPSATHLSEYHQRVR